MASFSAFFSRGFLPPSPAISFSHIIAQVVMIIDTHRQRKRQRHSPWPNVLESFGEGAQVHTRYNSLTEEEERKSNSPCPCYDCLVQKQSQPYHPSLISPFTSSFSFSLSGKKKMGAEVCLYRRMHFISHFLFWIARARDWAEKKGDDGQASLSTKSGLIIIIIVNM